MSEQLPYNDEQWNELPVPDKDTAWQKMELLLDRDKKRRIPFWWWRYAALGLLLTGIAVGGWLWFFPDNDDLKESTTAKHQTPGQKQKVEEVITLPSTNNTNTVSKKQITATTETVIENSKTDQQPRLVHNLPIPQRDALRIQQREEKAKEKLKAKSKVPLAGRDSPDVSKDEQPLNNSNKPTLTEDKKIISIDSLFANNSVKKDSAVTKDSIKKNATDPIVANDKKKEEKKKNSTLVWSAGIGLQQAIAVNGQQSSSYNYKGKENSLADHIPSVYLRVQKGKWFAQSEFHYAIPQPVQNFYFSQKTRYDATNASLNTERFAIQKLYYHQLPFSLNYHLLPNVSVGAGGVYNILAGAVTEQEVKAKNVSSGTETTTRTIAPVQGYKDSFLYKTTAGIILQTDYHWKRFSLGLRFTRNLQPFIKYTKPDGTVFDEKNNALQVILRLRLWSSK